MVSMKELVILLERDREHLATKADLANTKFEMVKWVVGVGIGIVALNISIMLVALRIMMN